MRRNLDIYRQKAEEAGRQVGTFYFYPELFMFSPQDETEGTRSSCKIHISSILSILLKERVRGFSVEAKREELNCVIWRYSLWCDDVNLIIVKMESFLINAQLKIIYLVPQGFDPFQDVSIQRVSMLGSFEPSISLNVSLHLQIKYLANKQIRSLYFEFNSLY